MAALPPAFVMLVLVMIVFQGAVLWFLDSVIRIEASLAETRLSQASESLRTCMQLNQLLWEKKAEDRQR